MTNADDMKELYINDDFVRVCSKCAWLMKAHWGLKVLKVWRPTPKAVV